MEKIISGVLIKVKNLSLCKAFYRDVLELGEPVLNSSFLTEFRISDSFSLFLERDEWAEIPSVSGRVSWFCPGNADRIRKNLADYGYPAPAPVCSEKAGIQFCRFSDPEGNEILIADS